MPFDRAQLPALIVLPLLPLLLANGARRPASPAPHAPPPALAARAAGRVEGTVVISKRLTARRPRFRLYAGDGAAMLPPDRPLEDERSNVIVYLAAGAALAGGDDTPPRARMQQINEQFQPHVLPVLRGTQIDFPNDDAVFHNVFSLSSARVFDLGRYPRGSSKSLTFERPGVVQVFCHIHADMSAVVLVLDNPYFTRPDSTGHFVLDGVPAGEYRIVGWHERIRPIVHTVRVEPGRTTSIDFDIPIPAGDAREP